MTNAEGISIRSQLSKYLSNYYSLNKGSPLSKFNILNFSARPDPPSPLEKGELEYEVGNDMEGDRINPKIK